MFNHVGIILKEKMEGMIYVEPLKVHITDCSQSPNKIEFLYFEPDSPLPARVTSQGHIAYEVKSTEEAIKDAKVIFGPFDMGNMILTFVEEEGIAIEFKLLENNTCIFRVLDVDAAEHHVETVICGDEEVVVIPVIVGRDKFGEGMLHSFRASGGVEHHVVRGVIRCDEFAVKEDHGTHICSVFESKERFSGSK